MDIIQIACLAIVFLALGVMAGLAISIGLPKFRKGRGCAVIYRTKKKDAWRIKVYSDQSGADCVLISSIEDKYESAEWAEKTLREIGFTGTVIVGA